jgi:tetratricopeptide (TPR) repeat protein
MYYRIIPVLSLILIIAACTQQDAANGPDTAVPDLSGMSLTQQVVYLVELDEYEQALDLLGNADQNDPQVMQLKRDTHLLYGLWLTYSADSVQMSERMGGALRHFRRVLQLDPGNSRAQAEIEQIEGIYTQMGRPIPEGVAD